MTANTDSRRAWYCRFGLWVGLFTCVSIIALCGGVWSAIYLLNRPTGTEPKAVEIQKGMTVHQIGERLYADGLIRSPRLLEVLARINGTSRRLTAGMHPFHGGMTTWQVLLELEQPRDVTRDVTLPEGLRKEQVAHILATDLNLNEDKLLALMSDSTFCHSLGVPENNLEGYLFPETYKMSVFADESRVLKVLVDHFFEVFNDQLRAQADAKSMSMHDVVTLASIVEGEARRDDERPVIAAVYLNRLKENMRLQADPTVQYALPGGPRRLFYKDYEIESPYNTYLHAGLPPGPILSPGRASLEAVLFPAQVDYLYFVARGDGSHIFSRTPEEHEVAKRRTLSDRLRSWNRAN